MLKVKDVTEIAYESARLYFRKHGKHLKEFDKLSEDEQAAWNNRVIYQIKCPNVGPYGNRMEPNKWHALDGVTKAADVLFHKTVAIFVSQPEFFGAALK